MSIPLTHVQHVISDYLTQYPDQAQNLAPLTKLFDTRADLTHRKHLPGHITVSAAVIAPHGTVLHIHHNTVQTWLLPGGHCEPSDTTLLQAALREVHEETGITPENLTPATTPVIDIDIHTIAANPEKNEPEHWHADLRHTFFLAESAEIVLQKEEVSAHTWLPIMEMRPERLSERLRSRCVEQRL